MAVQLSSFYMRNSFQLLVKLDTQKFGVEGAFEQASQKVYSWGKNKFRNVIKNAPKFEELACFSENGMEASLEHLWYTKMAFLRFEQHIQMHLLPDECGLLTQSSKLKIISAFLQ